MVHGVLAVCLRFMASEYTSILTVSIRPAKIFFGQRQPHFFIDKLYFTWQNFHMNKGVHSVHLMVYGMSASFFLSVAEVWKWTAL